ncbi:MAG: gas vesicle protein GvpG [Planctomycetota bacterium]
MFILDDIALAPIKGFLWLARELHGAAEREFADERDRTMRALQSLHMRLEAGQIDETTFDDEESRLLDRLDELDGLAAESESEVLNEGQASPADRVAGNAAPISETTP